MFCRICNQKLKSLTSTTEWERRNVHISCLKADSIINHNDKIIIFNATNNKTINQLPDELLKLVTKSEGKRQLLIIKID